MSGRTVLVVTSISAPNRVLSALAQGAGAAGWRFLLIGDRKSPPDFALEGVEYLALERQVASGLRFARSCPTGHYARKNVGYLLAARSGADWIVETDDDNHPEEGFFGPREAKLEVPLLEASQWSNVYRYFTAEPVWPRGLPLSHAKSSPPPFDELPSASVVCPIQQGLANNHPDVDAVYRLVLGAPVTFQPGRRVGLGRGAWCPFNSQNTSWRREAFALLYLPAYCSFRLTDIWRSFVAQRIGWENEWPILFHSPTVRQDRNEHDLMRDFADEVPGYLHNDAIARALDALRLAPGVEAIPDNLRACYALLIERGWIGAEEADLLECWLGDLATP